MIARSWPSATRSDSSRAWNAVPRGVVPRPLRGAGETLYWLPRARRRWSPAIGSISGDAGGELRVCPESWLADVRGGPRGTGAG